MATCTSWRGVSRVPIILLTLQIIPALSGGDSPRVRCVENGRFYREGGRNCSEYFLCLEGEVFEFRCTAGLNFNEERQICGDAKGSSLLDVVAPCTADSSSNVASSLEASASQHHRHRIAGPQKIHKPSSECSNSEDRPCDDGTCLPEDYFCDGSLDCLDGSDEESCDVREDWNSATLCNVTACQLPECFCSRDGTVIPGRLNPPQVPQMIVITFEDSINFENWDLFNRRIFNSHRRNPNGCPLHGTFYVNHQFNNYHLTQILWNYGHEIAVHSITNRRPEYWWSHNATIEDWFDEMIGHANIIHKFSKIRMSDINGLRAPHLSVGWNRQFLMMKEFGFAYDSSIIAPLSDPPLWPYTLDYKIPHACLGSAQNCPTHAYPEVWEMVINQLSAANKYTCGTIDSCPSIFSEEDAYRLLFYNFKRHYYSNRAPYGLHLRSAWFKHRPNVIAFEKFLDEMMRYPDVWFVTNWQVIQWLKKPTSSSKLKDFEPWNCRKYFEPKERACSTPNVCKFTNRAQQDQYLHTCTDCPKSYPWIRNEFGKL